MRPGTAPIADRPVHDGDRRLLLVSYHFGAAGASGGFRWHATAEGLRASGWTVDVITAGDPQNGASGEQSADGAVRIHRVAPSNWPQRALERLFGTLGRIRRRGAAPPDGDEPVPLSRAQAKTLADAIDVHGLRASFRSDVVRAIVGFASVLADRRWVARAKRKAYALAASRRYACVVVSSPPHATQMVGVAVARRFGVPYVADVRDPWFYGLEGAERMIDVVSRTHARIQERRYDHAAAVVVHNTGHAREAVVRSLGTPTRREVIPNGYDGTPSAERPDRDCFRIVFGGWLHNYMDVRALLSACGRLRERHAIAADRMRIEFVGTAPEFHGVPLTLIGRAYGVDDCVRIVERQPRSVAAGLLRRAAVLVAFDCLHPLAIPMKFYDYLPMYGSPLLLGVPDGATARSARRLGIEVCSPQDRAGTDLVLDGAYRRWLAYDYRVVNDPEEILHRRHRVAEMDVLLTEIGGVRPADVLTLAAP